MGGCAVTRDPVAWLVMVNGRRVVFVDRVRAEEYAAQHHGTVHALYLGEESR